jgi:uncharacterized membrane protein YdjX (TVP38/TMEM64 family)
MLPLLSRAYTPPNPAAARPAHVRLRWAILAAGVLALILLPFAMAGEKMDEWSVAQLRALGDRPLLVALLVVALLAADVLLPVPSSVVATLAGVTLGFVGGAAATLAGMVAGCVVAYGVGHAVGAPAAERMVGAQGVQGLHALARRHGVWGLAVARPVPVLAEASTLLAGAAAMPFGRFLAVTTASNLGIAAVYAAAGAFAANVQSFLLALAAAVLVPVAGRLLFAPHSRGA